MDEVMDDFSELIGDEWNVNSVDGTQVDAAGWKSILALLAIIMVMCVFVMLVAWWGP